MRFALLLILAASIAHADSGKPADRARATLEAQLKDHGKNLQATFAKDAVLLTSGGRELKDYSFDDEATGSPHFSLKSTKIKSLVAGGDDAVVWFTAEVTVVTQGQEPGDAWHDVTRVWRMTELLDGATGKVVVAAFDAPIGALSDSSSATDWEVPSPTAAGPLAALLGSATALDGALSTDANAFVVGTDANERGVGGGAKKLVKSWAKLKLTVDGKVREVVTKKHGFAVAKVSYAVGKKTYRMRALLVAVPTADGKWSAVGVHFVADR